MKNKYLLLLISLIIICIIYIFLNFQKIKCNQYSGADNFAMTAGRANKCKKAGCIVSFEPSNSDAETGGGSFKCLPE
jgi:hypothetical protein